LLNQLISAMNTNENASKKCKRCNRPVKEDIICQECKSELLAIYEASSDWQTAFEIERATQAALRYQVEEGGEDDFNY
jgi:recombinational DNA repair protein RecR